VSNTTTMLSANLTNTDMNTNDFNYGQTVCKPRATAHTFADHSTDLFGYVLVCRITKWTDQQEGWS
jgi:hypothetical protein